MHPPDHPPPPAVSVIMTARNEATFLPEALDSLMAQTLTDFEVIIVNDGSTDETAAILDAYAVRDSRFRPIHQAPAGRSAALNAAWQAARSDLLAVMDADDLSMPHRLERQIAFLSRHPEVGLVAACYEQIDSAGRFLKRVDALPTDPESIRQLLSQDNPICHGTVMVRRTMLAEAGGYRREFPAAVDYDMILRVLNRHNIAIMPEVLCRYRVHGGSMSSRRLLQLQMKRLAQTLYREREQSGEDSLQRLPESGRQAFIERFMAEDARLNRRSDSRRLDELGRKYERMGDTEAAIRLFRQAAWLDRGNFRAWRRLVEACLRRFRLY